MMQKVESPSSSSSSDRAPFVHIVNPFGKLSEIMKLEKGTRERDEMECIEIRKE
jgi:hypothetical protein